MPQIEENLHYSFKIEDLTTYEQPEERRKPGGHDIILGSGEIQTVVKITRVPMAGAESGLKDARRLTCEVYAPSGEQYGFSCLKCGVSHDETGPWYYGGGNEEEYWYMTAPGAQGIYHYEFTLWVEMCGGGTCFTQQWKTLKRNILNRTGIHAWVSTGPPGDFEHANMELVSGKFFRLWPTLPSGSYFDVINWADAEASTAISSASLKTSASYEYENLGKGSAIIGPSTIAPNSVVSGQVNVEPNTDGHTEAIVAVNFGGNFHRGRSVIIPVWMHRDPLPGEPEISLWPSPTGGAFIASHHQRIGRRLTVALGATEKVFLRNADSRTLKVAWYPCRVYADVFIEPEFETFQIHAQNITLEAHQTIEVPITCKNRGIIFVVFAAGTLDGSYSTRLILPVLGGEDDPLF